MASRRECGRSATRDVVSLAGDGDVANARREAQALLELRAPSKLLRVRILTVVSELARNAIVHGGGGVATFEICTSDAGATFRVTVEDDGPGIPDMTLALRDGYSTGRGLGLGLPGSRRLADTFEIVTRPATAGTRVVASFRL